MAHLGEVVDDRHGQCLLRREVEIHCAFGEFGLCQDVIEADHAVRAVGELACCGGDESMARGVGSSFAGLGHLPPRLVAVAAPRQFNRRVSPLDSRSAGSEPSAGPPGSGAVFVDVFRRSAVCSSLNIPRTLMLCMLLAHCKCGNNVFVKLLACTATFSCIVS